MTDAQKALIVRLEQLATFKGLLPYYTKPTAGIPATDMTEAVQTALTAAGTALQPSDISQLESDVQALQALIESDQDGAINKFNEIVTFLANITDSSTLEGIVNGINTSIGQKYTKPSTGIPATDLAQGVQDSLALANSALQNHQDISGKAEKSEMSVVDGTGDDADKVTITLKTGTSTTVLKSHQDISGKVDKITGKGLSTNDYSDADKAKVDALVYATDSDIQSLFA